MRDRPLFAVAIPTRNRRRHVARTLDALDEQTDTSFPVTVVDQSDSPDLDLETRAAASDRLTLINDPGRGLSRARNVALEAVDAEWIAYVDDDCLPERDWAAQLREVLECRLPVDLVSGHVSGYQSEDDDYATVTTLPVNSQRIISGRWVRPWEVGFGVCMVVRRDAVTRLGGWDERLGAGVPDFPAAEDMDFNYRLTRSGGAALHAPSLRVVHDQWRPREQLPALYYGYSKGWAGFAIKHLRTGDARGGLLLWGARVKGILKSFRNAAAMRSRLRLRIAWWEARGLANGTLRALGRRW